MENQITLDMVDDWAGAAMQGLMTSRGQQKDIDIQEIADLAYRVASEMARARGAFIDEFHDDLAQESDDEFS